MDGTEGGAHESSGVIESDVAVEGGVRGAVGHGAVGGGNLDAMGGLTANISPDSLQLCRRGITSVAVCARLPFLQIFLLGSVPDSVPTLVMTRFHQFPYTIAHEKKSQKHAV